MNKHPISCLTAALLLSGCQTSQLAMDEANHGVSLTTELKAALSSYAARQEAIDALNQQQIDVRVKTDNEALIKQPASDQLQEISGQGQRLAVVRQLRSRIVLLTDAAAMRNAIGIGAGAAPASPAVAALALDETLGGTGKAFSALGTELKFSERAAVAADFVNEVRKEVKENQDAEKSLGSK
jgi:hypothetical protein